jgi:hypothetical protein
MPTVWQHDVIRELLTLAEKVGKAEATLADASDARSFRFAIYRFRNQEGIGLNLSITLDDNKLVVTRREAPSIEITYDEPQPVG